MCVYVAPRSVIQNFPCSYSPTASYSDNKSTELILLIRCNNDDDDI